MRCWSSSHKRPNVVESVLAKDLTKLVSLTSFISLLILIMTLTALQVEKVIDQAQSMHESIGKPGQSNTYIEIKLYEPFSH